MHSHGNTESLTSLVVRLGWALFGPIALFLLAAYILRDGLSAISVPSVAFVAVVLTMIGLRKLEIVRYEGTTLRDRPATPSDFRRYTLGLLLVSGGIWFAVHAIGG